MAKFILSAFADEADPMLDKQIEAMKEDGIFCVEMRGVDGKNVKDLTDEEATIARQKLAANGMEVASMGSPFGKIGVNDDFEPHFEQFKRALHVCRLLGTKRMRMFSFYYPKGEDPAKYRDVVIKRLSCMLDEAEKAGIEL